MKKSLYLYNLGFLKIVFAAIIVLYHFIRKMGFWCEGGFAVELFFVISGFLLVKTYNSKVSFIEFTKKKFCTFMPYLIMAVVLFLPFSNFSIQKILNNILLVPVFSNGLFLIVGWYIIVWFWLLLFLFWVLKYLKKEYALFCVGLGVFISVSLMLSANNWLTWPKIGFLQTGWYRGIAAMGAGYLLAYLPTSVDTKKRWMYTLLEAVTLIYCVGCMFVKSWYISPFIVYLTSVFLVYLFVQKRGWLSVMLNQPVFKDFEPFFLPIYLLQQTPIYFFEETFKIHKPILRENPYITIFVTLFCVFLYGILVSSLMKKIWKIFRMKRVLN